MNVAHDGWFWCWRWYVAHGVAGNLVASALVGVIAGLGVNRVWRRHIRPHIERTKVLHEDVLALHRHLGVKKDSR